MERIMVQLDAADIEALDEAARESGMSRAALARQAICAALTERRRARELDAVVEAYTAKPPESLSQSRAASRKVWPA